MRWLVRSLCRSRGGLHPKAGDVTFEHCPITMNQSHHHGADRMRDGQAGSVLVTDRLEAWWGSLPVTTRYAGSWRGAAKRRLPPSQRS